MFVNDLGGVGIGNCALSFVKPDFFDHYQDLKSIALTYSAVLLSLLSALEVVVLHFLT